MAILRLSSPAQYTKNVRPVCLAPQGANVQKDTVATVVGWGLTSETGPRPPVLQEITFKVWDNAECKNVYGSMAPGGITEHMLCAGKKGQDSCMGDSGGPMVRLQGSSYQQIGIVSWGIGKKSRYLETGHSFLCRFRVPTHFMNERIVYKMCTDFALCCPLVNTFFQ